MGMYVLKFPYRKILLPLARSMKNINPDLLSYLAVFVAFLTGLCFYFSVQKNGLLIIAAALTFLRMTLNTIDGVIAIERGNLRLKGEIVNALPDRYSDIFVLLGVAFSAYCNVYIGSLAVISVLLVSYTGMMGKAIGVNWQHHGPLGKVERLTAMIFASILQYTFANTGLKYFTVLALRTSVIGIMMVLFIVLAQVTVYNRVKGMLAEIKEKENVR